MGGAIGVPELLIVLMAVASTVVPLAIAIWVIFTLFTMRGDQQPMRRSLENIEHLLRQR
jgi:hypothetical protein